MEIHDIKVGKTYVDGRGNKRELVELLIRYGKEGVDFSALTIVTIANGTSFQNTTTRNDEIEKWTEFVPSMMTNEEIIQKFAEAAIQSKRTIKKCRGLINKLRLYSIDTELDRGTLELLREIDGIVGSK